MNERGAHHFGKLVHLSDVLRFARTFDDAIPEIVVTLYRYSGRFGRNGYERLRARAMVLTMRYTGLRIADVAMLAKDRVSRDGPRWRVFLHAEKTGKPIPPDSG